ncbi:hypothetical protein [Nocardia vermiculata]|uniref:hypothetical protein n=1 Tax=Nocardia vermiculata TaxID=257274 RepID=UPI000A559444|nr:hypothetical protein [Nocardia vermiculata]
MIGTIPLALVTACSNSSDQSTAAGSESSESPTTADRSNPPSTSHKPDPAPRTENHARPELPTSTTVQPGVVSQPSDRLFSHSPGSVQPGVTAPKPPPRVLPSVPDYVVPENFRAIPHAEQPAPPVNFQNLHAPQPVEPVAPIAPPPRTLRMGDFSTPAPDQLDAETLNTVNTAAANTEAAIATGFNSVGINPSRSDKIAGATIAGAATGAVVGAAAAGIPVAVVGGVVGGAIGTTTGALVAVPSLGATIPAGTIAGAAIGAAATGLPAAAAGAVVGGVVGGVAGAAVGTAI